MSKGDLEDRLKEIPIKNVDMLVDNRYATLTDESIAQIKQAFRDAGYVEANRTAYQKHKLAAQDNVNTYNSTDDFWPEVVA